MASDLLERAGPTLRALSGIDDSASENEARRRLLTYLNDLADELPEDLRTALRVGLALHEDAQYRFLEDADAVAGYGAGPGRAYRQAAGR